MKVLRINPVPNNYTNGYNTNNTNVINSSYTNNQCGNNISFKSWWKKPFSWIPRILGKKSKGPSFEEFMAQYAKKKL